MSRILQKNEKDPPGILVNVATRFSLAVRDPVTGIKYPIYLNVPKLCFVSRNIPLKFNPRKFVAATLQLEAPELGMSPLEPFLQTMNNDSIGLKCTSANIFRTSM